MNINKAKEHIEHMVTMINFLLYGEGVINKDDEHSDYDKGIYTPEDILGNLKYNAENALQALKQTGDDAP